MATSPTPTERKKALDIVLTAVDEAHKIFQTPPDNYDHALANAVLLPPLTGVSRSKNRTIFGRKRWWEQRGNENQYFLKPTAPAAVQQWESQEDLRYFHRVLNHLYPGPLSKAVGSNLGALQLVVDVIDHLMLYRKIPLSALSSTIIAHLTSATLLLNWPSEFLEAAMSIHQWQNENVMSEA